MVCNGYVAGRIAASRGLATFSNLEMQHSPKIFCIFLQKVLAKNRRKFMTAKYQQIALNDIFSDFQSKLIDNYPLSLFFFQNTLISMNLFHPSSIRLSGFSKVPDTSLLSRFKHDFDAYIELMFQRMVDHTEPICQQIHVSLSQTLTFDTSGIELYVTEDWALSGIALLLMMAILNPLIQILPSRRKPILLTKISPLVMPPL